MENTTLTPLDGPLLVEPFLAHADYLALGFTCGDRELDVSRFFARKTYINDYGYALITREVIDVLVDSLNALNKKNQNGRAIDAGSGSGFLAAELCAKGANVLAVDLYDYSKPNKSRESMGAGYPIHKSYQLDMPGDATILIRDMEDVTATLLVWPPYARAFAHDVACAMHPGQVLFYCGEGQGGATGNDPFFDEVQSKRWQPLDDIACRLNAFHICFPLIHDAWKVYLRLEDSP